MPKRNLLRNGGKNVRDKFNSILSLFTKGNSYCEYLQFKMIR